MELWSPVNSEKLQLSVYLLMGPKGWTDGRTDGWVEGKIMTESDKRSEREQETFRLNFISESIFTSHSHVSSVSW